MLKLRSTLFVIAPGTFMSVSNFAAVLAQWQEHAEQENAKVSTEIRYLAQDEAKLKALADVYRLPFDEVVATLLHHAILAVEEKMPYVAGEKVIRVEEGAHVYEDVGPMAGYLKLVEKYKALNA